MHPTLQLLERLNNQFINQSVSWFDCPDENPLKKSSDKHYALNWHEQNDTTLDQQNWQTADINILLYPKSKERLHWWLNQLSQNMKSNQLLWVVGQNDGGIKSLPKRVKENFDCVKVDSARHCVVYELTPTLPLEVNNNWQSFSYGNINAYALPGVFAAGKLDKGTEVLLNVLPELKGSVMEFGAGCGILTTVLAKQTEVTKVTAIEIDLLAVRSCLNTLKENDVESKATVIWSAGTANLPDETFDSIVTNPPFHQGIRTAYEPTEQFFKEAKDWLKPGGSLIWVANNFLNYQDLLKTTFRDIEVLAHEKGFKVFRAVKN